MSRAAVLLADGFEEVEAVTPIDFLRRAGVEVIVTGVTGDTVTGAREIVVRTDRGIEEVAGMTDQLDAVVLPGGMPGAENLARSEGVNKILTEMNGGGKLIAAICASPAVVLEPTGILAGKRVTCYPGFEDRFTKAAFETSRVVVDGNILTSRGPGTAAEFAVEIIRRLAGDEAAKDVYEKTLQK
jgi:4-methyl-5(b-hydroxyethyl)-thiazole monophosphate biosynthesis